MTTSSETRFEFHGDGEFRDRRIYYQSVQRVVGDVIDTFRVGDVVYIDGDSGKWIAHIIELYDSRLPTDDISVVSDSQASRHFKVTLRWFYYWDDMELGSRREWILHHRPMKNEVYFSDNVESSGNCVESIISHAKVVTTTAELNGTSGAHICRCFYGFRTKNPPPLRELSKGELANLLAAPSNKVLFREGNRALRGCLGPVAKGVKSKRYSPSSGISTSHESNSDASMMQSNGDAGNKESANDEKSKHPAKKRATCRPPDLPTGVSIGGYNMRKNLSGPGSHSRNKSPKIKKSPTTARKSTLVQREVEDRQVESKDTARPRRSPRLRNSGRDTLVSSSEQELEARNNNPTARKTVQPGRKPNSNRDVAVFTSKEQNETRNGAITTQQAASNANKPNTEKDKQENEPRNSRRTARKTVREITKPKGSARKSAPLPPLHKLTAPSKSASAPADSATQEIRPVPTPLIRRSARKTVIPVRNKRVDEKDWSWRGTNHAADMELQDDSSDETEELSPPRKKAKSSNESKKKRRNTQRIRDESDEGEIEEEEDTTLSSETLTKEQRRMIGIAVNNLSENMKMNGLQCVEVIVRESVTVMEEKGLDLADLKDNEEIAREVAKRVLHNR